MESLKQSAKYKEEKKIEKAKIKKETTIKKKIASDKAKQKQKISKKVVSTTKKKTKTRWQIVKELDAIFSKFIRLRDADNKWMCICITCWEILHWKKIQCWHFISRGNYKYRRDENNCFPQCVACNIYKSWNYISYTLKMIKMLWEDVVKEMQEDKELVKISTTELREKIEFYKEKVGELLWKDISLLNII